MVIKIIPNNSNTKYILSTNNIADYKPGSKSIIDNLVKDLNKNIRNKYILIMVGFFIFFVGVGLFIMFIVINMAYLVWIGIILAFISFNFCFISNPTKRSPRIVHSYRPKLNNFYTIYLKIIPGKDKLKWFSRSYELVPKNNNNLNTSRRVTSTLARNIEERPNDNLNFHNFVNRNTPRTPVNLNQTLNNQTTRTRHLPTLTRRSSLVNINQDIRVNINENNNLIIQNDNNGQVNDLPLNSIILRLNRNNNNPHFVKKNNDDIPIVTYNIKKQIESYPNDENDKLI